MAKGKRAEDAGNNDREGRLRLYISALRHGIRDAVTPAAGEYWSEAAAFCLANQGHEPEVAFQVRGAFLQADCSVSWDDLHHASVMTYQDHDEAVEFGAMGMACVIIEELTDYKIAGRSAKGFGSDFWLSRELPSEHEEAVLVPPGSARLEVSGILDGGPSTVSARVRTKLEQTKRGHGLPAFVIVVEFGAPLAQTEVA